MSNEAIYIDNLSVSYDNINVLKDICISIQEGEYLGIIGPNGGGKSTLLKSILGLIPNVTGEIKIFGEDFKNNKGLISYVPQFSYVDRKFPITVKEVVLMGCFKKGILPFFKYSNANYELTEKLLAKVGLNDLANRQISELSGGEFQRMLIARALAVEPKILLLDEPTASVDAKSCEEIYSLLAKLNDDMTIILVTHDLLAISSQVKKIACLNQKLIYHGEPELNENIVNTLYGCPVDLIAHGVPHRVLKKHEEGERNV